MDAAYKRHMLREKERRDAKASELDEWAREALKWIIAMQLEKGVALSGAIVDGVRAWPDGERVPDLIERGFDVLGLTLKR